MKSAQKRSSIVDLLQLGRGRLTAEWNDTLYGESATGCASIGPRSFDRGKGVYLASAPGCYLSLQLGRGRLTAESCHSASGSHDSRPASIGPRSFDRGKRFTQTINAQYRAASIGPRSFDRGKVNLYYAVA